MKEKISNEKIYERLDTVEELLKMLVVNSLVDDLKESAIKPDQILTIEARELLKSYDMNVIKSEKTGGFTFVYIEMGNKYKYKITDYIMINDYIKSKQEDLVPVFQFKIMNGMQRKRFIEENISFIIYEKETYICAYK